jgi:indole-3-glycerol phosphate synthase
MGPNRNRNKDTRRLPETQADSRGTRSDILARIVATKREELALLAPHSAELRARALDAPEPRDFEGALRSGPSVSLIAEVKRRSPGAGPILPDLDPAELAGRYTAAGASAISVLTDGEYFGGSLADLATVRAAVPLPVLRKDFLIGEEQVWEARSAGADAILLIAGILEDGPLTEFRVLAESMGMTALVEVHDEEELERAVASGVRVLGINNRDLRTFRTTVETTIRLLDQVPLATLLVSESGIHDAPQVERLGRAGVDAILVGEAILRAPDPGAKAAELSGHPCARRVQEGARGRSEV